MLKLYKFDVTMMFLSTTSEEGFDRDSLDWSDADKKMIKMLPKLNHKKLIVHMVTPSAVLTKDFADADAILLSIMPGIGFGSALKNVLFGNTNPSGKLTFTMPNIDNE